MQSEYYSGDQSNTEMGGARSTYGEKRGACRVLAGRPEGNKPFGRPRHRWEDDTKMDLQDVGWGTCTELIWLRIGTGGGLL
jgi:hypothetical protein